MKRILISVITLGVVTALALGVTSSFFSDTETSKDNILQAGALDLKIDNESYYNGVLNEGTSWSLDDLTDELFFNFTDIKPGDWGEDTISLHAENDYWACMEIETTENDDESCTEPEIQDDLNGCNDPDGDPDDGELAQRTFFMMWPDDGDNVLETDESPNLVKGPTFEQFSPKRLFTLADSLTNFWGTPGPLSPSKTYYIGKVWCHGNLLQPIPLAQDGLGADSPRTPANSTGGVNCDGSLLDNATQTDKVMGNISFSAVQARNNPNFSCSGVTPTPPTGTPKVSPSLTPSPTPLACGQADVMLVLDRSGSISLTELGDLKTAAKAFIDSLGLSTTGVHAGFSSFATFGSLNQHLNDDGTTVKTAIDTLISGGWTNLKEGIDLSKGELNNPGDLHDRTDGTSPDKMIVITDGNPNRPESPPAPDSSEVAAANSADAARLAGSEIFVVGVGSDVDATYLQTEIANDAGHYYSAANYAGLQTILSGLDLCE